jgi:predicted esterase
MARRIGKEAAAPDVNLGFLAPLPCRPVCEPRGPALPGRATRLRIEAWVADEPVTTTPTRGTMSILPPILRTTCFAFAAAALAPAQGGAPPEELPAAEDRQVGGDAHMRYFRIGPSGDPTKRPAPGYRLLLVLPGGDGSAEYKTFVQRIAANAVGEHTVVAHLVAPVWTKDQADRVVWPTAGSRVEGMRFTTEQFVAAVIRDVERELPIDPARVFTLSWSSSGPAAYAVSLDPAIGVTGSFVAMAVWKPDQLPALKPAKGHAYYLLHSPQDFIPIRMAEQAKLDLGKAGAKVEFQTYEGGHGWRGDVYGMMRTGLAWLDEHHGKPDAKRLQEQKQAKAPAAAPGKQPAKK